MVHIMLSKFFHCTDSRIDALAAGLGDIASKSRVEFPEFELTHQGVSAYSDQPGNLFLDFTPQCPANPLQLLRTKIGGLAGEFTDSSEGHDQVGDGSGMFLPLMQYARLSSDLFSDAVVFAKAVVDDLGVPSSTTAWRLALARFQSQAAGDDWSEGGWAADISWELVASYPL